MDKETPEGPVVEEEQQVTERSTRMDAIVANRREERAKEEAEFQQELSGEDDLEDSPGEEVETESLDDEDIESPGEEVTETGEDVEMVTVKINGEERQVPIDEVMQAGVRTYQKESAADKKLEQVANREARLSAREQELAQMEAKLLERQKEQDVDPDEYGREFAEAVFDDEEKVASTITNVFRKLSKLEAQVEGVHSKEAKREQEEVGKVHAHYHNVHKKIATDPDMHTIMNVRQKAIAQENPGMSMIEVIDMAAEQVYEKFNISPGDEPPSKNPKRQMPKRPKSASVRTPVKEADKPKSRSDTLAEMRKRRTGHNY